MAIRGTKKTIEALEVFFETGKKPTQQHFFDWMASFYHKDEDISFLINLAKATTTDMQVGEDNARFVTALRVYQAILWWVRLGKLPLLQMDVQELITDNINDFFNNTLMAVDDSDTTINTLGELILAFQDFQEQTGGINSLRDRIIDLELVLHEVPKNLRQVQNVFDSLQSQVTAAQNTANTAVSLANNAQATADNATTLANNAQATADNATGLANNAQATADNATGLANNAQATADNATTLANNAQDRADDAYDFANSNYTSLTALWDHVNPNLTTVIGQVATLGSKMNNAESNIGDLQSRMGSAEGNIGNLQGRMGSAEGNISTLISDLNSTIDALNSLTWRVITLEGG